MTPIVKKIHHVAYRCKDALETARWYEKHLHMKLILSIAEDAVPSTGEADPYMHIFMDAGMGNVLAFFELPTCKPMGCDQNTPAWTQHLALDGAAVQRLVDLAQLRLDRGPVVHGGQHGAGDGGYGAAALQVTADDHQGAVTAALLEGGEFHLNISL